MILRLLFSFFFLNLVTGEQRLDESTKTARSGEDQVDVNADSRHATLLETTHTGVLQNTQPPLEVVESHYEYPAGGMISTSPVHLINPHSQLESPILQVPRPLQNVQGETEHAEKTICFTPSMVHRMIKAALDYVSHQPASDINKIVEKLDQELSRISDAETLEENAVRDPLYPLDSKAILKTLHKQRSGGRTNLMLKYELPGVKKSYCREALEKLIEIAYIAYLELEENPQCRDYLYNYAANPPDARPTGHLNEGPDLKSLIASILDKVHQHKPNLDISPQNDHHDGWPTSSPQNPNNPPVQENNIPIYNQQEPQIFDYNNPQKNQIPEYNYPQNSQILDYNNPQQLQILDYNNPKTPQNFDYNDLQQPQILDYNNPKLPQNFDYNNPQQPQILDYNNPKIPQIFDYNGPQQPQILDYNNPNIPKNFDYNNPQNSQILDYNNPKIPQIFDYNDPQQPQVLDFNIPQNSQIFKYPIQKKVITNDIIIPQTQYIEVPEIQEKIRETIEEITPMKPEKTINILIGLLPNNDQIDNGSLLDRFSHIIKENYKIFHPRIFELLLTLLNAHKQNNIHRFNDIVLLLLDFQRNRNWPWSDRVTEDLLSYLKPDQNGHLDSKIVEIILNWYKNRPNEQEVEYILPLLRPMKEGNVNFTIGDLILKLIYLRQHNLMRPDHVEILLKLLKLSQDGYNNPTIDIAIIDNLSRWNEIGLSPNQLNELIALLNPYVNGNPDRRPIYLTHFLLYKAKFINPKQLDFILWFLHPENGVLDARRVDIIIFILNNVRQNSNSITILLTLLQENERDVLNSAFLEILLLLNSHSLLTPELVEIVIYLLANEVTGQLEGHHVKNLFIKLVPLKQSNPKLVVDILTILNQDGLYGNIFEVFEKITNKVVGPPNWNVNPWEVQPPDDGSQTADIQQLPYQDFMSILKWLESQGLITQDQGSNTDLVNKVLNILKLGHNEPGVVELTYMLKHEKPLIYQPVYYVKYRLPILSFISNLKTLLLENPNLNADPVKLLQELIVISNVTEVSPNLQGKPKEEILKLTFNDGDLVQAKILDEQNLSLNEQITYVHGLNSDITPEELLELNKINEAKYFPNLIQVKGVHPEALTIKEVDEFLDVPPVLYKNFELPAVPHQTKTIHKYHQYIARDNPKLDELDHNNNAQLNSQESR